MTIDKNSNVNSWEELASMVKPFSYNSYMDVSKSIYEKAYNLYIELKEGDYFEEDLEDNLAIAEQAVVKLEERLTDFKDDLKGLKEDFTRSSYSTGKKSSLSDKDLKHYRTHFYNLKNALESTIASVKGIELSENAESASSEAILTQITALKELKTQIEQIKLQIEAQITALSRVI